MLFVWISCFYVGVILLGNFRKILVLFEKYYFYLCCIGNILVVDNEVK